MLNPIHGRFQSDLTHLRDLDSLSVSDIILIKAVNCGDKQAGIHYQVPAGATIENPGMLPSIQGNSNSYSKSRMLNTVFFLELYLCMTKLITFLALSPVARDKFIKSEIPFRDITSTVSGIASSTNDMIAYIFLKCTGKICKPSSLIKEAGGATIKPRLHRSSNFRRRPLPDVLKHKSIWTSCRTFHGYQILVLLRPRPIVLLTIPHKFCGLIHGVFSVIYI